jgi:hypothetical protein
MAWWSVKAQGEQATLETDQAVSKFSEALRYLMDIPVYSSLFFIVFHPIISNTFRVVEIECY